MPKSTPVHTLNRARVSVAVSQFTVPLLGRIYAAFDGDMVAALVLGEIAHRNVEGWLARQDNPEDPLYAREQREQVMKACNALSIAEACRLPRETVRRKVVKLIEDGYVYRNAKGHLYLAEGIGGRFDTMLEEIVEGLLVTAEKLRGLLPAKR
jgi:hypothetical protein